MITFKELYSNLDELKVVNIAQRKKMAIRMKRMTQSSAFKQKVARSKLKIADPAKMQIKATKLAKKKIVDKLSLVNKIVDKVIEEISIASWICYRT